MGEDGVVFLQINYAVIKGKSKGNVAASLQCHEIHAKTH